MKTCSRCRRRKEYEEFNRYSLSPDGRQSYCRLCSSEAKRHLRLENPEYAARQSKKWRSRRLEAARSSSRAWNASNRDKCRDIKRRWRERNREKCVLREAQRRARKYAADTGTVTRGAWKRRLIQFGCRCAYCGSPGRPLEQEHVEPLTRGGLHDIDNLVPACKRCNASKNSRFLLEWVCQITAPRSALAA